MRRAAQVLLLAAAGALVAPAVAEACWSGYYCESYGYDAGGSVYGYSRTYGYYGTYFLVETSITDSQWSTVSNWAEGMFQVTAEVWMDAGSGGDYYIEGNHYSSEWEGWYYDGTSYYSVYVLPPPPPPQITVCPLPSPAWGPGSQSTVIGGSGFWGNTPQVSWSGNGGVNFLESSTATVTSDSQIDLSVSLLPVTSEGSITLNIGPAACLIPVLAEPTGCGDVRDQIIQEYLDYGVNLTPQCSWFTQTAHSEFFQFSELKHDNPYSWALIRQPLTVDKSSGYGLDRWRQLWGASRISESGYRSPYHNAHLPSPGAPQSRHMYGDAMDLRNESQTVQEYNEMANAAKNGNPNAGASYVEELTGPCSLVCVHADWRNTAGPYSQ